MDQYFQEQFEGLKQIAQHLMAASQEIALAGAGLVQVSGAAIHARAEHEDLKVTVHRLEELVLEQGEQLREQGRDLKALRERLNGGGA